MSIILSWKNNNPSTNTIKIYRSEAAIDPANPPLPVIASLPGNATTYTDNAALGGKNYYYLIQVTDGQQTLSAKTPVVTHIKSRGPGPGLLQQGDDDCGYYGEVSIDQMPFLADCWLLSAAALTTSSMQPSVYHKFAWKGRILYIADRPILSNWSGNNTRKHLRSGLKFNFTNADLDANIPNIVTHKGFSYHARVPRSTPEDWDGVLQANDYSLTSNPDTEFNQLIGALTSFPHPDMRKLTGIRYTDQPTGANKFSVAIADVINKATLQGAYPTIRLGNNSLSAIGYFASTKYSFDKAAQRTEAGWYNVQQGAGHANWSSIWPVFELIES